MLELRNQKYNNTDYSVLPQLQQKYFIELERSKKSFTVNPAAVIGLTRSKPSRGRKQLPLIKAPHNHLPGTERSVARSKAAQRKRRMVGGRARMERKLYGSKIQRCKALYDNEERSWTAAGKEKAREQRLALRLLRYNSATMIQKHYRLTFNAQSYIFSMQFALSLLPAIGMIQIFNAFSQRFGAARGVSNRARRETRSAVSHPGPVPRIQSTRQVSRATCTA